MSWTTAIRRPVAAFLPQSRQSHGSAAAARQVRRKPPVKPHVECKGMKLHGTGYGAQAHQPAASAAGRRVDWRPTDRQPVHHQGSGRHPGEDRLHRSARRHRLQMEHVPHRRYDRDGHLRHRPGTGQTLRSMVVLRHPPAMPTSTPDLRRHPRNACPASRQRDARLASPGELLHYCLKSNIVALS